jgi:hypothetical protein
MAVIPNKWVEKEKKKRGHETARAFDIDSRDTWKPSKVEKSKERHSPASMATMRKTLRGIRR